VLATPSNSERVWTKARLATMAADATTPYGAIEDGVVIARNGRIAFAGPRAEAPAFGQAEVIDCEGRWITPGLIDCHTHLVLCAATAPHEFETAPEGREL
jgi:imidazolonepropionase